MQCMGDEFFARAAFAVNKHTSVRGGGEGDLLAQRLHRNTIAEDLKALAEFFAKAPIFQLQL